MIYLGTPGRMVGLKCPVSQRDTSEDGYRFVTTLEGRRKAQIVPGQRRVWDISVGKLTTPAQVAALQEFVSGSWGPGPFWFVPEAATLVNVMSPHEVLSPGVNPGGPMQLDDGVWAATSRTPASNGVIGWYDSGAGSDPPVLPGRPVTASAYVEGVGGYVRVQFFDGEGQSLGQRSSGHSDSILTGTRLSVSTTAPPRAARARITVRNATRATRPAITWTDYVTEWGEGLGCAKAVVSQASRDLVRAIPGVSVLSELSFVVTEVG